MSDIAFLVYGVAILALIGVPAALLLPPGVPARLSLAPVLGYCSLAILSPNLFQAGLSVHRQLWLYGGLAAVGLACLLLRARRGGRRLGWRRAESLRLGAAWALAAVLLSLPKWIAGEQYYVYLGNIWDYFNYVSAGALFVKLSPAELSGAADPAVVLHNPMLLWSFAINFRPSAILIFSALADPFLACRVPLFALANAYMSLTLSLYLFGLYFLLRNATSAGPAARVVIPLVFVSGFWGSYLLDVDAWAQLGAVMLMPVVFALGLQPALAPGQAGALGSGDKLLRLGLGMALVVGAALYIYPELLPVYAPIYCTSLLAILLTGGWNGRRLIPQFIALALGLLLALPYFSGTLGYMAQQMRTIVADPKLSAAWFKYFQGLLLGGDDLAAVARDNGWDWATIVKYLGAAADGAGLYRVLPEAGDPMWMQSVGAAAGAALLAALGWCAWRSLRLRTLWLPAGLLAGAAIVGALALEGNLYGAGKSFFWLSPFILVFLLLPLGDPRARWPRKLPASVYMALQAITMLIRLESVATQHGIPGLLPYPGDLEPVRKEAMEINLARLFERLDTCRMVRVDLEDAFLRHYVMVNLFVRDVPYFSAQPINSYYRMGTDLGLQSPGAPPDCTVRAAAPEAGGARPQAFVVEPAAG